MANLIRNNTLWSSSVSQTSVSKTYTFDTESTFVDKNIALTINVPGIVLTKGQSFYIKGPDGTGPTFTWTCDAVTGEITITGSD